MSKVKYEIDFLTPHEVNALGADLSHDNEYIVETAGFVPLEVKMKQFEQNGIIAQFMTSDFTSNDYRDIYLNPDFEINPEDDLEDINEKLRARKEFAEKIKQTKSDGYNGTAGTQEPEKESEKKPAEPVKDE